MLRSLALATSLVVLAPVAVAESAQPQAQLQPQSTLHYRTLEKMLRKFSRQAGDASSRGKIFAQR